MSDYIPPLPGLQEWLSNIQEHIQENGESTIIIPTPQLNMHFDTEIMAFDFYNAYARKMGFGIRREYGNTSKKDGILTSRRFTCQKEGSRGQDKRDHLTKEPRAETRTGCKARMCISFNRVIKKYSVIDFVVEHNHDLQPPPCVHMIRSHRNISDSQAAQIDIANDAGLTLKASHELMVRQGGGRGSLGHTKLDHKNHLRTKRQNSLKFGEVGALLMYFKQQQAENPSFFYDFQMDSEDEITNIMWADAKMINDYGYFGDVISFDTTYGTNKDCRPLGVFVGFNNHRQMVVFGGALMYDETIPSFEWLFKTFIKAMGGKKPKTILTDQAAAMASAIATIMPETYHGLCTWHIRHNAIKRINHLYQKSPEFTKQFEACMDIYEEEEEFLRAWDSLISDHNVTDDSWLHSIFQLKKKWAWAYVRGTFSAGMRSTQLSESINSDLKSHMKSNSDLTQFFTQFERVVDEKRYNETKAEYESRDKLPKLKMRKAPMLVQAGKVYTPKILEEFQEEYEECQGAYIKECKEDNLKQVYIVANVDESKDRSVTSNSVDQTVSCDCKKFETHGILCSHALKVLDVMNIKYIPEHYILKRWTRDATCGVNNDWKGRPIELDRKASFTQRYRELCPQMVKLTNRASESHETYIFLSKVLEESWKTVENMLASKASAIEKPASAYNVSISMTEQNDGIELGAAKGIKKRVNPYKGNKRPRTWVEKLNRKRKNVSSCKTKKTIAANMSDEAIRSQPLVMDTAIQDLTHADTHHTFTQLLTKPLDYQSISLLQDLNDTPSSFDHHGN